MAEQASQNLKSLGYNVEINVADGTLGWEEQAPFSAIIVTAASFKVPSPLIEQLEIGGRIIIPLGGTLSQTLTRIDKLSQGQTKEEKICGCVFVPLIGKYGFKE